jgi:RHS repeat-associated protein
MKKNKQLTSNIANFIIRCTTAIIFIIATAQQASANDIELVTFYHNDLLGSPVAATDELGNLLWREEYQPYGQRIKNENSTKDNPLWYTGKAHDESTGLTYFGARYYDPLAGRFMGVDPVGFQEGNIHSFNRYAYANNNPYKFVDQDGNYADLIIEAASITYGIYSFRKNLDEGNFGSAAIDGAGVVADTILAAIPGIPGAFGLGIKATRETAEQIAKRTGDLTKAEIKQIQNVVNEAGRPLEVVGSAAKGTRRGVGSNLPVGKGSGTKSDIDVLIPPSSKDHFKGVTGKLPDADVNIGTANPHIGTSIRFEPK